MSMLDDFTSTLPILVVDDDKIYRECPQIGFGSEAEVRKYGEKIAIKNFIFFEDKIKLVRKFKKIELLGKLHDEAACFPLGFFESKSGKNQGYYCDLVNPLKKYKDFDYLLNLSDTEILLNFIIAADDAIQRFHKMGLILGDIKGDNIMIDHNKKVKFVDTDNWMYQDYGFDVIPYRSTLLNETFNKEFSLIDNDRFVFAMMAIQYFASGTIISLFKSDSYFKKLIEYMDVDQEVKDGLRLIFSDSNEKPYIGPILKKINPEQKILTKEAICSLNRHI